MDISKKLGPAKRSDFWLAIACMVVIGAVLRLKGIHSPILDHPGWRQGDTAAIARNFATLRYNIFFPQTDYNGPPPNYVELELQIVPFLAATLYKLFGVHEIFGRLISLAFGLGTIALVGAFARRLFVSEFAGVAAAALYAIFPGSIYYSRTFMPDTAMVFFFTAAIYACARYFWDEETDSWRGFPAAALLLLAAFLAKPVAVVAIVPIACASIARFGWAGTLRRPQTYALLAVAFIPLVLYDRFVAAHAEWHWASGITQKHVIPSLLAAFTSGHAFVAKFHAFVHVFHLLRTTMLGPVGLALLVLGFAVPYRKRDGALLYGWLAGALVYAYIVVTVERVDYYLYLVLPLAALVGANFALRVWQRLRTTRWWRVALAGAGIAIAAVLAPGQREIAPYYAYSKPNYVAARALDATLPKDALVVVGHYDPSVLYYINRKGWEEDPYLWTPFDEQSAIRKGSRYLIAIEHRRLLRNVELSAWLERFPVINPCARWPVYETDPAKILPGAEERWKAFRRSEKAGLLPSGIEAPTKPCSG